GEEETGRKGATAFLLFSPSPPLLLSNGGGRAVTHKVGILTGGGDCPGLNAVIRAVVRKVENAGGTCVGLLEGWRRLITRATGPLTARRPDGIIARGGTTLGSSRTTPYKQPANVARCLENFKALGLTALVAIGGDDPLGVAARLHADEKLPAVGVPKTID